MKYEACNSFMKYNIFVSMQCTSPLASNLFVIIMLYLIRIMLCVYSRYVVLFLLFFSRAHLQHNRDDDSSVILIAKS
jgi:hypothetical protein